MNHTPDMAGPSPWHLGRLAGFDTESSGVDVENDRIVTASIVEVGGKLPPVPANWLSDVDGMEIPTAASDIHGVTTERARAEGRPAREGVEQLVAALSQLVLAGTPIVIMNAPFDLTLLDREARRHGVQPLTDIVGDELHVIDPRVLDKHVDTYRPGKRTLTDLCRLYGVRLDGAHSADADAVAACRVAWRLGGQYPKLAELAVPELHKAQVEWAAEQAASFQAHLRKKDPNAVIDGSWPLRLAGGEG